jgi:hypothetical protein
MSIKKNTNRSTKKVESAKHGAKHGHDHLSTLELEPPVCTRTEKLPLRRAKRFNFQKIRNIKKKKKKKRGREETLPSFSR